MKRGVGGISVTMIRDQGLLLTSVFESNSDTSITKTTQSFMDKTGNEIKIVTKIVQTLTGVGHHCKENLNSKS